MADIVRADSEQDERRCQGNRSFRTGKEQCINQAMEGSQYCAVHGGNRAVEAEAKQVTRNYQLARWKSEVDQKVSSSGIKGLREEIGILRVIMQERLEFCKDSQTLILQSGPISELASKIQSAVIACHKLEGSMGRLLDKQAVIHFASVVIGIISKHVTADEAALIADEITSALANIGEEDE